MSSMYDWLSYNRPDVTWIKGPDSNGQYSWDESLHNQEQILELVGNYDSSWINPNVIPQSVTPRQMRIALILSGVSLETIESTIDSLSEPQRSIVRVTWEYSVEFQRNNPVIASMAPALGLSGEQINNLFKLAATL